MKYLKSFNESHSDILSWCQEGLIGILDKGFYIHINERNSSYQLFLHRETMDRFFTWDEISDGFINFLTILNDEYKIETIIFDAPIKGRVILPIDDRIILSVEDILKGVVEQLDGVSLANVIIHFI